MKLLSIPNICPVCGKPTEIKENDGVKILYCINPNCEAKLINQLDHFCGKKGLDIKGLSKATLEKLIDWDWIKDINDIFELKNHRAEWIKKSGFGIKSVDNILEAIEFSRNCDLHQFISAIGIPLIGVSTAKDLANHFKTWNNFISSIEKHFDFYSLPNFGNEMHNSIIKFNYEKANFIANNYLNFKEYKNNTVSNELNEKIFVITGKLNHFKNREELKSKIEAAGGKVSSSISKNTNFLINNDIESVSSKNKTAKSLNIPIISEENFISTFKIS